MRRTALAAALLLVLRLGAGVDAQDAADAPELEGYVAPGQEAPRALLSLGADNAQVGLFVEGSWRLGLDLGVGIRWDADGDRVFPAAVGSLQSGLSFHQEPELTLMVRLLDRFYVEAEVHAADKQEPASSYLPAGLGYLKMGYEASGDEMLRAVTLGTRGVEIGDYPYLKVPAMGRSSLGASASLRGRIASLELLIRVDKLPGASVLYIGMNRVEESRVRIDRYLRGRSFLLPDRDLQGLDVLLEDPAGELLGDDGRSYRRIGAVEGRVSAAEGSLELASTPRGRLLVTYHDAAGRAVGDAELGVGAIPGPDAGGFTIDPDAPPADFSWLTSYLGRPFTERQVVVGGLTYLRLWEPGEFSPFELASSYELTSSVGEGSSIAIDTVERGSDLVAGALPPSLHYRVFAEEKRFVATLGGDPRLEMRERFPFPDPSRLLYGPVGAPPDGYPDLEIRLRTLDPVEFYQVPSPVVPGSVKVVRNGLEDSRFSVDPESGRVDLQEPVSPGEIVQISYRSAQGPSLGSDLVVAWGNRIELGSSARLELAGGLLWSASAQAYTEEPGTSTGGLVAGAALSGTLGPREPGAEGPRATLRYDVSGGVSVSQADTTGVRRLFGMEGSGRLPTLTELTARPSAVPVPGAGLPADLDAARRGTLTYRDYRLSGALGGGGLLPYDTASPPVANPYVDGGITGPYGVGGGSAAADTGSSLALEFGLDDAQSWAGMQLPVSDILAGPEDLSAAEGIVLSLSAEAVTGSYDVYLQIGSLGEDLDGDGVLDHEASATSAGFSFDDAGNGVSLRLGAGPKGSGNDVLDSEDIDGNGVLDPEEARFIVLVAPLAGETALRSTPDGAWTTYSRSFTETERRSLTRSRSLRLLVVKSSAGECDGRLLIDRIELEGSGFLANVEAAGSAEVREVRENDLLGTDAPAVVLEQAFPAVASRFHPNGEAQSVLELRWSGAAPSSVHLRGFPRHGTGGLPYQELRLYMRLPEIAAPTVLVELSLLDGAGRGVHAGFESSSFADWRELVVDLRSASVTLGGSDLPGATVSVDPGAIELVELRVSLEGASDGRLYLDEIVLSSPRPGAGVAGEAGVELVVDGPILSVGDTVLVSSFKVRARAVAASAGFASLFGQASSAPTLRLSGDASLVTAVGHLELFVLADGSPAALVASGGHTLTLTPPGGGVLDLEASDSFSARGGPEDPSLRHRMAVAIGLGPLRTEARFSEDLEARELEQAWSGELGFTPSPFPGLELTVGVGKRARGFTAEGDWYFPWWVEGYRLFAPWNAGTDEWRKGSLAARLSLQPLPLGFEIRGSSGFADSDIVGGTRRQVNSLEYGIRLPLLLRPEGGAELTVAAGYSNTLSLSTRPDELGRGFAEDLQELVEVLGAYSWLLGPAPGVDVVSPAPVAEVAERLASEAGGRLKDALWKPSLSLALSRGVGSRLIDLALPVYADLSFGREVRLTADLTRAASVLSASVRSSALNLFGRSGAYGVFSFYDTDELSGSAHVELTAPAGPDTGVTEVTLSVSHLLSIASGTKLSAELENRVDLKTGSAAAAHEKATIGIGWTHLEGLRLPSFVESLAKSVAEPARGRLRHRESLGVEVGETGRPAVSSVVSVVARHESIFEVTELGHASANIGIGGDFRRAEGEAKWSPGVGIDGGIEIEIRF